MTEGTFGTHQIQNKIIEYKLLIPTGLYFMCSDNL